MFFLSRLEDRGYLDPSSEIDLFCLHYVFRPLGEVENHDHQFQRKQDVLQGNPAMTQETQGVAQSLVLGEVENLDHQFQRRKTYFKAI